MERYNDFVVKCLECGNKFKVDCDTCGYGINNGFCKWNMEHNNDPCTSFKYRWKPKKVE